MIQLNEDISFFQYSFSLKQRFPYKIFINHFRKITLPDVKEENFSHFGEFLSRGRKERKVKFQGKYVFKGFLSSLIASNSGFS